MTFRFTAPCHFGLEKTLSFEVKRAGGKELEIIDGRVNFSGDERVLAMANISCSVAERIGIVLAEFNAKTFDDVFDNIKNAESTALIEKDGRFPVVKGQSVKSALSSIPALQRTVKKALVHALEKRYKTRLCETGALFPVRFFLFKDKMSVYLDTTGDGLHKRGYRANSGGAPLKETLAAGICDIAGVRSDSIVTDPFCGSGTILIEAAFKALDIPPGINRRFVAENWKAIPKRIWEDVRECLRANIKESNFHAFGFDSEPEMVALATENIRKVKIPALLKHISVERRDIADFKYECENMKLITNPPYAERMLNETQAAAIYQSMGQTLFPKGNNEIYVINSNADFEHYLGQKATKNRKLYNGMLMCRLYQF
ncbi:MAG: class I SAM-dependent RNA methyltransferase [Oscillospiraceae bacterium]|nr:class I SAM-dependent RNA methyltransferase [Oscillospiraceae bacterium]